MDSPPDEKAIDEDVEDRDAREKGIPPVSNCVVRQGGPRHCRSNFHPPHVLGVSIRHERGQPRGTVLDALDLSSQRVGELDGLGRGMAIKVEDCHYQEGPASVGRFVLRPHDYEHQGDPRDPVTVVVGTSPKGGGSAILPKEGFVMVVGLSTVLPHLSLVIKDGDSHKDYHLSVL